MPCQSFHLQRLVSFSMLVLLSFCLPFSAASLPTPFRESDIYFAIHLIFRFPLSSFACFVKNALCLDCSWHRVCVLHGPVVSCILVGFEKHAEDKNWEANAAKQHTANDSNVYPGHGPNDAAAIIKIVIIVKASVTLCSVAESSQSHDNCKHCNAGVHEGLKHVFIFLIKGTRTLEL